MAKGFVSFFQDSNAPSLVVRERNLPELSVTLKLPFYCSSFRVFFKDQVRGQAGYGSKKRTGRTRQPLFSCKSIEKAFPMLKLKASGSPNAVSDAQMSIQLIRI